MTPSTEHSVFLDTGFFVAFHNARDLNHQRAVEIMDKLLKGEHSTIYTSDYVFDEALVHGLPIVSCRTGAVPQTVPQAAGLLVPPDDPDALAAALRRLLTEPDLRHAMAAAARTAGAALPGWPDTARIAGTVLDALP